MRVAFRCDASERVGTGHVMRCLTLARAAMTQGHEVCFFVSDIDAALEKRINATGIRIIRLPSLEYGCQQSSVAIEAEYETSQQETEARYFLSTVAGYQLDWIVAAKILKIDETEAAVTSLQRIVKAKIRRAEHLF